MKHATTRELYDYWTTLRGTRTSPERDEIDPSAIRSILADTFVLEVDRRRLFPIRLSGARVNALFAADLKGSAFVDAWRLRDRPLMAGIVESVLDERLPALCGVEAGPATRPPVAFELLLLPLRHRGRTHARLLGALSPAAVPGWFGLIASDKLALRSWRVLHDAPPAPAPAIVEPMPAGLAPVRRGHLLVYEGSGASV